MEIVDPTALPENARLALARAGDDPERRAEELHAALGDHPSPAWLERLPAPLLSGYLARVLDAAVLALRPPGPAVLEAAARAGELDVLVRLAGYQALRGETESATALLAPLLAEARPQRTAREAAALVALCRGQLGQARAEYTLPVKGKADRGPAWMAAFTFLIELTNEVVDLEQLFERATSLTHRRVLEDALQVLLSLIDARRGRSRPPPVPHGAFSWLALLLLQLQASWLQPTRARPPLAQVLERARSQGFVWIAEQLEALPFAQVRPGSLRALWQHKEPWQLTLAALDALAPSKATPTAPGQLHWFVELGDDRLELSARWVTAASRRGTEVSMARLTSGQGLLLRPEDHAIIARLRVAKKLRERLPPSALALLAGHPYVHDANGEPLTVRILKPVLSMQQQGEETVVQLEPFALMSNPTVITRKDATITITEHDDESEAVARALGGRALRVPKHGVDALLRTLGALGERVEVHAPGLAHHEEPADTTLYAQLTRTAHGLFAAIRIVPATGASARVPGTGPAMIMQNTPSGPRSFRRDRPAEARALAALLEACPVLAARIDAQANADAADLASALEVLGELSAFTGDGASPRVVLTWRGGTPLRVTAGTSAKVAVAERSDWLEIGGEVHANDGTVVQMKELLASLGGASGRFVPLGDERYLALTAELQQRLAALAHVQQLGSKKGLSLALLPALETVTATLDVEWSTTLMERQQAMQRAAAAQPRVPKLLQAELRDYQREGFALLSRQSSVGMGVVLADDMGLGKTVQTIAVLLERRAKGPALVVAPTGVLRNWEAELNRFAPSLRVHRFAEGDRSAVVDDARADEIVLASYGILPNAPELAARSWATLVFDEAHALKNPDTQRWAAARALGADARIALTGTPVENHIGELHALFDVVAPGVLGTRAAFQRVFAAPIARGDRAAANTLRQIVRPLVLRRTKAQVLTELPPKTELVQLVTASAEHRAFYEALRQKALETVNKAEGSPAKAARSRISILAEITRLRRAAIDPRLVGGSAAPAGSKLDRLAEVLEDLRAEGHRALVFSQFLEVLDLARERLEPLGFRCLRLDGTMNASARAAVVASFQAGEGDVLLASLKAGGVGINLTAADYVIHMDPWWNPAVEDQATDRAHRMGQERPVTVLRLVTEATLEEKVLSLHADKRRLFQDTVGDADGTGVLDVARLMELLA